MKNKDKKLYAKEWKEFVPDKILKELKNEG